jgi:thiol-disulfide isomerase/thioredoxin
MKMSRKLRFSLIMAVSLIPMVILSQEMNKMITDPKLDKEILCGYCDRSGLESGDFGVIFREFYKIYEPDNAVLNQLKLKKEGIEILIILGTWCSDSQEQVPRFFKILDKIKFSKKAVQMICVDRNKQAGETDLVNYNVQRVPTFIFYRKGREIGRIVETPYSTLEKDMLLFFSDN